MNRPARIRLLFVLAVGLAGNLSQSQADEIRIQRDLSYKPQAPTDYEQTRCRLDLYIPSQPKDAPSVLWFHGGALQHGDKAGAIEQNVGRYFASQGVIFISANYRLHPQVTYPAYIEDAAAAFAFVRQTIPTHGGSPRKLFLSGHSAGGYLVAMLALDPQYLAIHQLKTSDIAGVFPVTGQMATHSTVRKERGLPETTPLIDPAGPANHVRPDAPPFLNLAGSEDLPARAEENRYFIASLKAVGHPDAVYLEVAGRNHGTVAAELANPKDVGSQKVLEFIRRLSR